MQNMINRWSSRLAQTDLKQSTTQSVPPSHPPKPEHIPIPVSSQQQHSPSRAIATTLQTTTNMKKSLDKSKKSLHSHKHAQNNHTTNNNHHHTNHSNDQKIQSSKRLTTPSKKKSKVMAINTKFNIIEKSCDQIFQLFAKATATDKSIPLKLKQILQQLWTKAAQTELKLSSASPRNNIISNTHLSSNPASHQNHQDMQTSIMRQSTLSNSNANPLSSSSATKRQQRLYQDLQRRYFQSQKQKSYLKNKIQEISKKYQNIDKQLDKYYKMEKLLDKILQKQEQTKEQNKKIKYQLHLSQMRQIQQQRIFQKEINIVKELVQEIKNNLPST